MPTPTDTHPLQAGQDNLAELIRTAGLHTETVVEAGDIGPGVLNVLDEDHNYLYTLTITQTEGYEDEANVHIVRRQVAVADTDALGPVGQELATDYRA